MIDLGTVSERTKGCLAAGDDFNGTGYDPTLCPRPEL